ncbi:nitrate transporter [Marinobacter lipolyticus]|uniref:CmpA/NrtA family ABC transporter substrate-binding protein n=1 Tax=Marinobacter lipolyticus TaxID=209639 RepID=UPI001BCF4331|nr:CmpA/NrtA family ABC transporter substrate-binding protein [Marinobacter lipolyticus]MBS8240146.1 nitrate transporter [Marinobacter lipolyticus]
MVTPTPLHPRSGFHLRLGFVPLLDSAPLIMAEELGLFEAEGLRVELVRESSWASLRDKVSFGLLEGGQMLAPMPLSMSLASDRPRIPITSAMVLSRNGNGITLGNHLFDRILQTNANLLKPIETARALVAVARQRQQPIRLASVAPWSSHDLQLRDWLDSAGAIHGQDFHIIPVSPVQMMDALQSGAIEGCCVGEPWNSVLERRRLGHILHSGHQIWQNAPEKVVGVRSDWAAQHQEMHRHLIRALLVACRWLDCSDNHAMLAQILSQPEYLGEYFDRNIGEQFPLHSDGRTPFHPGLHQHFFRHSANFPWLSQAHWLATRLIAHRQLDSIDNDALRDIVRPDIFRDAAGSLGIDTPVIDSKTEGQHQRPFVLNGQFGPVNVAGDYLLGDQRHDWRCDGPASSLPANEA